MSKPVVASPKPVQTPPPCQRHHTVGSLAARTRFQQQGDENLTAAFPRACTVAGGGPSGGSEVDHVRSMDGWWLGFRPLSRQRG